MFYWSRMFWSGRSALKLLALAMVYAIISSYFAKVEIDSVRNFSGGVYFGRDLLCRISQFGIWGDGVNDRGNVKFIVIVIIGKM